MSRLTIHPIYTPLSFLPPTRAAGVGDDVAPISLSVGSDAVVLYSYVRDFVAERRVDLM